MSIYIPNMKLPEACEDCPLYSKNSSKCLAVNPPRFFDPHALAWREPKPDDELEDKPSWCPLIEVPPHGRLGDLDELEFLYEESADGWRHTPVFMNFFKECAKDVREMPTIIPADPEGGADG